MCYGCYESMGKPTIVNEKTCSAANMIDRVFDFSPVGGNAHIVIDDWNLEDDDIMWCLTEGMENGINDGDSEDKLSAERECLLAIRSLTEDERASAMAIHEGWLSI